MTTANPNDHAGCIACVYKVYSLTQNTRQLLSAPSTCELGVNNTALWGAGIGCPYFLEVSASRGDKTKHKKQAIAKLIAAKMGARTNDD